MYELCDVSRSFDGTAVVERVDLAIEAGKTTVLIGPSGCGKSTLLRLMLGLIAPGSGTVKFEGAQVTPLSAPALRRRMGYVIQGGGLFPHLTARENVALLARHLGWERERIDARIESLARLAQIAPDVWERYPIRISGGQQQRIALLRALMLDPDVLLLDEPLGALDPIVRADLQEELKEVFDTLRKSVVLVTHDMSEAAFFADTIVLMKRGRIVQSGTFRELDESPEDPFVTRFIRAQRSFAAG
ncbi:MAG: ABC transporter ATP-binding protein [Planctomycetes bacterium]|jgi:osmoprotectant transport system ATP-binding protein|nr:ABC transporter ATP-binding protein [Planctomycetota bacterium]MED6334334.1 ATP-binding cassette domain-containing protein [Planctomycetota bacterium]